MQHEYKDVCFCQRSLFFCYVCLLTTGSLLSVSSSAHKLCQARLWSWILITFCDISLICWTADVGRWVLVMRISFSDYMLVLWSQLHIFHCMWPSKFIGTYINLLLIFQKVYWGRICIISKNTFSVRDACSGALEFGQNEVFFMSGVPDNTV